MDIMPASFPSRSTMGRCRICFSSMTFSASSAAVSRSMVSTGEVITSRTRVCSGSRLSEITRSIKSRSLNIPTRRLPSVTATAPMLSSVIVRTACMTVASGFTVTNGVRAILSRPINSSGFRGSCGGIVAQHLFDCTPLIGVAVEQFRNHKRQYEASLDEDVAISCAGPDNLLYHKSSMDMVVIPEGWFWMGSENRYRWESPRHRVWVDAFAIAKTAVTRRESALFLATHGHAEPSGWSAASFSGADQPVV